MNKSLCWGLLASLFLYQSTHAVFFMDFGPQIACTGDDALKKYPQVCKIGFLGNGLMGGRLGPGTGTLLFGSFILTAKHLVPNDLLVVGKTGVSCHKKRKDPKGGLAYFFHNLELLFSCKPGKGLLRERCSNSYI